MPLRRSFILVVLTAILCALLGTPAQASATIDDASTPTSTPTSGIADKALDNVRALLGGDVGGLLGALPLPEVLTQAVAPVGDLTLALRDLALHKDELSGAARTEAESYLARPTDPAGPRNPDRAYSVHEATPVCGGAVCVHYVNRSNDAPSLTDNTGTTTAEGETGNRVPDYIDLVLKTTNHVHDTYVAAGYRAPKGDGALGGGSNKTDIYVADIGDDGLYGYCTTDQKIPDDGPYDAWAYCVVDDDYAATEFGTNTALENLQVTLAHEYFHAVQFGYDITEDSWFLEATAAWVEDEMYDDVDDNLQYLKESPLRLPRVPMDTFAGGFHYGTWIFIRYLSERYPAEEGGLPTVVRDMVRKMDGSAGKPDLSSIESVKAVLLERGAKFPALFARFSALNRRPAQSYSEGRVNRYPHAPLVRNFPMGRGQTRSDEVRADHLTSATVRFTPSKRLKAGNTKLRLMLRMAKVTRGSAAVASIKLRSGEVRVLPIRIKASGAGIKSVPFSVREVKYVELTLANAGTNYRCFNGGPYSCQGSSKNDDVVETFRASVIDGPSGLRLLRAAVDQLLIPTLNR
jgi:hypothetical protein